MRLVLCKKIIFYFYFKIFFCFYFYFNIFFLSHSFFFQSTYYDPKSVLRVSLMSKGALGKITFLGAISIKLSKLEMDKAINGSYEVILFSNYLLFFVLRNLFNFFCFLNLIYLLF